MDKELILKLLDLAIKGENQKLPFEIGKSYFIRTATYHCLGKVKNIIGKFLTLDTASWIADSGRFMDFLDSGLANEVEPVHCDMFINTDSICDAFEWKHKLLTEQK